jgi:hypothetical protein
MLSISSRRLGYQAERKPSQAVPFQGPFQAIQPTVSETILLVVVVLTAVIGSCATLALTFATRAGYDKLEKGWGWWYFARPFTASGIGVLAYALLQGGFLGSGSATSPDLLAAGAIGALSGLFTDQLLQKMRMRWGYPLSRKRC